MTLKKFCSALTLVALVVAVVLSAPLEAQAQDSQVQNPQVQNPQAQNPQALLDRIDRLERDIRTLNQQIARMPGEAPAGEAPASAPLASAPVAPPLEFTAGEGMASRLMVRLGALESEVRAATGQSESLSFRIDQLTQRFDKLLVDLDYRLQRLEGANPGSFSSQPAISAAPAPLGVSKVGEMPPVGAGGDAQGTMAKDGTYQPTADEVNMLGQVSQAKVAEIAGLDGTGQDETGASEVAAAPAAAAEAVPDAQSADANAADANAQVASVLPEGSVQERYRFAFDLTRQARYEEAEIAFRAFIGAHGEDALANNARYWLAETYYVRKRFMDAAQAFFEAYQKAPQGPKAPDALLKLGMSMAALDKSSEACATFGKLRKEFTPLKTNIEQALGREVKRLQCQ